MRRVSHAHRRSCPHNDGLARSDSARCRQSASAWHGLECKTPWPRATLLIVRVYPRRCSVRRVAFSASRPPPTRCRFCPPSLAVRLDAFLRQLRRGTSLLVSLRLGDPGGVRIRGEDARLRLPSGLTLFLRQLRRGTSLPVSLRLGDPGGVRIRGRGCPPSLAVRIDALLPAATARHQPSLVSLRLGDRGGVRIRGRGCPPSLCRPA